MKKSIILPLLSLLIISGCNSNTSSTNSISSSFVSNTISSTIENSSTSSSEVNIPTKNIVDVDVNDLELIENEDKTGYLINKYNKFDNYIRLPKMYNDKPIVGIVAYAFYSSSFEEIYIPDTYVDFDNSAFYSVFSSQQYFIDESHSTMKSIDGVIYSKDGSELIAYPIGRKNDYSVVEGTKVIKKGAFMTSNVINVSLPNSIEEIQESAFESCKRLRSINIPSNVKVIKESTFDTCSQLKNVSFSEGLEKIEYRAFWQCTNINTLNLPSSLREISESGFEGLSGVKHLVLNEGLEKIGDFAFAYAKYIETITFPSTLRVIGKYAFMENYVMEELNLVEGIETLEEGAFFYNANLRKIYIPSTLKNIGFDCFTSSDSKFETLVVSSDNPNYSLKDGILYSKDQKTIVFSPSKHNFENGTYVVPEGVERIHDHAFYNNSSLRKIVLPTSLKEIGKAPFYVCNLNEIEYLGTMDEFKNIVADIWYYPTGEIVNGEPVYLNIYWFILNYENALAITTIKCNDGILDLINLYE